MNKKNEFYKPLQAVLRKKPYYFLPYLIFIRGLSFIVMFLIALYGALAQIPTGFTYQAVIRDNGGEIMVNQNVNIGIDLLQGSENGSVAFSEFHITQTNAFGLVNLRIGSLNPDVFNDITWQDGPYYIKISVNGLTMGVSPLLSVPYAMYALSGGEPGPPGAPGTSSWTDNDESVTAQVRVGIGTSQATAALHVANNSIDGNVLFQGSFNDQFPGATPANGTGTRMLWYPAKAAFRAGRVSADQWDAQQIGSYSMAMGLDALALGKNSFSVGEETEAAADHSVAMGLWSVASGYASIAMGVLAEASGYRAVALGTETKAMGDFSLALGFKGMASGTMATAMGNETQATGNTTMAWGAFTKAVGDRSTSWGTETSATGTSATAWGSQTTASASGATAWGVGSIASGINSVAWGNATSAINANSASWGNNTQASGQNSTAFGSNTVASGLNSVVWGAGNSSTASYSSAWGQNNQAKGTLSTAWGIDTEASGGQSTAWGLNTLAAGTRSTAWGYETVAHSANETVLGHFSTLYIPFSQVNINGSDRLFVVGNGSSDNNRSNALTLLKNGKISIGNTNPAATLHVKHNVLISGAQPTEGFRIENGGSGNYYWTFHTLNSTGALAMYSSLSGSVGIGYFSPADGSFLHLSSRGSKNNISPLSDDILSRVLRLKPVQYRYKHLSTDMDHIGFIAEDVAEIFPQFTEMVDVEQQIMAVDYTGFSVVAIKAIQQQQVVIDDLKTALVKQQQMINELTERLNRLEQ